MQKEKKSCHLRRIIFAIVIVLSDLHRVYAYEKTCVKFQYTYPYVRFEDT